MRLRSRSSFVTLTDNNVLSGIQSLHVLSDGGPADAGVALGAHVVAKRHDHLSE